MSHPRQSNGFRFGCGRFVTDAPILEKLQLTVPGESLANIGFELLAGDGAFIGWFQCVVDACEAMRRRGDIGKIVRCVDRALIKRGRR